MVLSLHIALGLSRIGADVLATAGFNARAWRDEMNAVIGMNRQIYRDLAHSMGPNPLTAEQRRFTADVIVSDQALAAISRAAQLSADLDDSRSGPLVLLAALMEDAGCIEATTARFWGMSLKTLRESAGLVVPRRELIPPGTTATSKPAWSAPIVLLGGGHHLPVPALAGVIDRHGGRRIACLAPGHDPAARGPVEAFWAGALKTAGAQEPPQVVLFDRADASRGELLELISGADIIVLDAGYVDEGFACCVATPALEKLAARLTEGVGLLAYSRGAQMLGVGCLSSWETWGGADEPLALLAWLPYVIMPHGSGAAGIDDLRQTMKTFPGWPGLGVAHGGAVELSSDGTLAQLEEGYEHGSILLDTAAGEPSRLDVQKVSQSPPVSIRDRPKPPAQASADSGGRYP